MAKKKSTSSSSFNSYGGLLNTPAAPAAIAAPIPAIQQKTGYTITPAPAKKSSSGGGGMSTYAAPAAPAIPSDNDWLASDSVFQAAQAAYQKAYEDLQNDINARKSTYETDYGKSLKDLGFVDPDANVTGDESWNWDDPLTASGRSYQNQLNDFAARGMLKGSGYADSLENLIKSLNSQRDNMGTARTNYLAGLDREGTTGASTRDQNIRQAQVEALQRKAAQYATI